MMRLPPWVVALSCAGLIPFFAHPLWVLLGDGPAPERLDALWLGYVGMIASFMAGSFWGFALPAAQGPAGLVGLLIASLLMLLAWAAFMLPFAQALVGLALTFLLLLLADFWRERTLGSVEGYFLLRSVLTAGALIAIGWRLVASG